jgi:hypothetical protein
MNMQTITLREFLKPDTEEKLGISENNIVFFIDKKGEQNILGAYALDDTSAKVNYIHNQVTKTETLKLSDTIYYTNIKRFKEMNIDKPDGQVEKKINPTTRQDLEIVDKHKKVKDINDQIVVKLSLLKMADIATMLMLFIFMVGFYVADPFHLVTFITDGFKKNPAELFTYFVLLAFAGIMAYTIAHLKREHYHHTARHNKNVWKVGIILVIFSMTGEIYNSLGSQQHSQFSKAESSEMFKSIAGTEISVNTGNGLELAQASGKLAACKTRLAEGKEKTCSTSQARVDSLKESATIAANAGASAATAASAQKTKDMMAIVDLNVHPFYKALAEMGIPQKIAALLLAAFVAYAFERMHLTLPEDLKDLYQQKTALDADLLELNKSNLTARNANHVAIPESELGKPEITVRGKNFELPPEKAPMGFISQRGHFKYEDSQVPETTTRQNFIGFNDPNKIKKSEKGILNKPANQGEPSKTLAVSRIDQNFPVSTPRVDTAKMTRQTDTASETQGICPQCGTTYELTRWNKRFCSDHCKDDWHNAQRPERERHIGKFKV